ncbi:MAG: hypothetical protein NZ578_02140 [Candidatus Binatia bacterium]|nr:hypothetical protein [Candidatus Binatia bacterium]
MMSCARCHGELVLRERVGRRDTCPHCGADLHCCLNCALYDPRAANACREPDAEPVADKERSNFCEYFTFRDEREQSHPSAAADARARLEALFKKKP